MTTINNPNFSTPLFLASKSLEAFLSILLSFLSKGEGAWNFWLLCRRLFQPPKVGGLFLFLKGVAHRRCALSMAAMQQGELVFIDAVLTG
jgi:hypothetical protein